MDGEAPWTWDTEGLSFWTRRGCPSAREFGKVAAGPWDVPLAITAHHPWLQEAVLGGLCPQGGSSEGPLRPLTWTPWRGPAGGVMAAVRTARPAGLEQEPEGGREVQGAGPAGRRKEGRSGHHGAGGAHRGAALVSLTVSRRPSPRTVPGVQCPEARANGTSPGGHLTRGVMTRPGSQAPTLCSARRSRASDSSPVGRQTSAEEGPHPLWSLPRRNPVFPRTSNIRDTDWPSLQPPLLGRPPSVLPFLGRLSPSPRRSPGSGQSGGSGRGAHGHSKSKRRGTPP